ncbi:AMP-binding protein [Alkaliflexus imshenetskii]|uniref:AMP-binding protein n=1 Tax=Alkaliflexus imshenetskii TaxID=286730 RepID=UPI00047DC0A7|nr:AMP-binding protein [Alkaliflexus imshenetskii]
MTDNQTYHSIIINGKSYSATSITELSASGHQELSMFLSQWWNDSPSITVTTSGSTGTPKPIQVQKKSMLSSALRTIQFFELQPGMSALLCLPVSFIAGKMMVIRALAGRLNLITTEPSGHPLKNINQRIDFAAFTPMQMLNEIQSHSPRLHHLQKVIIGGGKVDETLDKLLQNMPFEAFETYGMTETLSHVALRQINGDRKQSSFVPLQGISTEKDARGCLILHVPDISEHKIVTNDLVIIHPDKSFNILGRVDNIINSGGIKISPERIEEKIRPLMDIPFVISAVSHPSLGQQVVLVMEYPPPNPTKLLEAIKTELEKFEIPARIYVLNPLPRTESGKIQRQAILEKISGMSGIN